MNDSLRIQKAAANDGNTGRRGVNFVPLAPKGNENAPRLVFSTSRNAFSTTKNGFFTTKNGFFTTKNDFFTTKNGFFTTKNGFFTTKNGFFTTKNGFFTTKNGFFTTKKRPSQAPEYPLVDIKIVQNQIIKKTNYTI